ncbi:hypothetical protein H4Q26_018402 [Puccinia striiformis f. sp. tritici PST-130]|nr:hypothetical protein H4Q26_018402 [Puccinia striiformis f. sp. tritici PST-130]
MPGPNQVKWEMAHTTVSSPSPPNQPHPLPKPPHLPLLPRLLASEPVEAVFGRDFPFVASSQRSDPLNYNFVTPSRKPTCLLSLALYPAQDISRIDPAVVSREAVILCFPMARFYL